ncbi:hypothetical protein F4808DRAFT_435032 [Astrocystis sublimbata]|nr:hypothetical protein F4808DRAFT_435032 [Astrocystis sublimbata]
MEGPGLGPGKAMRKSIIGAEYQIIDDEVDAEDELAMPIVTSDVTRPAPPKPRKTLSSVVPRPKTPRIGEQPTISAAEPSPSPSQMRLAVHIRSSPITPFTLINAPGSGEPSALATRMGRARGRPPKSQTPSGPATPDPRVGSGLGADNERPSSEVKKRGRPKGWKAGMRYTNDPNSRYLKGDVKAADSSHVHERSTGPKRRGRPPRPLEPSVRDKFLSAEPEFKPYKCEWVLSEGSPNKQPAICPAELHNLDTLRKHVLYVHGDRDPLTCRFVRCNDRSPPLRFDTDIEFQQHMEKKHFRAYLWHMGEGYQNNGIETLGKKAGELPTYLFDNDGSQVTPSVTAQRIENDMQRKDRKRKLRHLLIEQNENAPSEEEWKKQILGMA